MPTRQGTKSILLDQSCYGGTAEKDILLWPAKDLFHPLPFFDLSLYERDQQASPSGNSAYLSPTPSSFGPDICSEFSSMELDASPVYHVVHKSLAGIHAVSFKLQIFSLWDSEDPGSSQQNLAAIFPRLFAVQVLPHHRLKTKATLMRLNKDRAGNQAKSTFELIIEWKAKRLMWQKHRLVFRLGRDGSPDENIMPFAQATN